MFLPSNEAPGFMNLPCKILLGSISPMSTKFLLYCHEKEVLKWGRLCEKFRKRKLECNVVAYLVASKILRSTEIKFEVAEGDLGLFLKKNIMLVTVVIRH